MLKFTRHGFRRIAIRLAGSNSPYASIVHRPRFLTTSTLPILRSSRLTSHLYVRRAFASEAEKLAPATEQDTAEENVDALAQETAEEAVEGAAPAPAAESSVTEEVTAATSEEPLQPETTSAEPLNLDEIQPIAAEREPAAPTAEEAERAAASGDELLESQATPAPAEPAPKSEAVKEASATIAEPPQQPETFQEAPSGTAQSVVTEAGAVAAPPEASRTNPGSDKCLYIGNLFFEITDEDLRKHFQPYGQLVGVHVITDMRGVSRGYVTLSH